MGHVKPLVLCEMVLALGFLTAIYDDATQHKTPSVCTELARSKTFGKIKRRRCCGTRAKVSWGMSNIVVQQGKSPFKDETIDSERLVSEG
jgi:hypothetical protein